MPGIREDEVGDVLSGSSQRRDHPLGMFQLDPHIVGAEVPSSFIATGGEVEITVHNPPPGGGTSNALILPVSSFSLNPSPATATVNAGQSATFTIGLTPQFGSFDAAVSFDSLADCPIKISPLS